MGVFKSKPPLPGIFEHTHLEITVLVQPLFYVIEHQNLGQIEQKIVYKM